MVLASIAFCVDNTFTAAALNLTQELAAQMDLQKCRRLKGDTVPTLFERPRARLAFPGVSEAGTSGTLS